MKRRFSRVGFLGLALIAVMTVGLAPAAVAKKSKTKTVTKTATVNQCLSTFVPIPDSSTTMPSPSAAASIFVDVPKFKGGNQDGMVTAFRSVDVRISHTFDGDLILNLLSPGGKLVTLAAERGSAGDGYGTGTPSCAGTRVFFGDAFAGSILTPGNVADAPILGFFKPEGGLLSSFVAGPARGFWTLIVTDEAAGDVGTINAFSLDFDYTYQAQVKKKKKKK